MRKAFKRLIVSADVADIAYQIEDKYDEQLKKAIELFGTDEKTEQYIYTILNCIDLYKIVKKVIMEDKK